MISSTPATATTTAINIPEAQAQVSRQLARDEQALTANHVSVLGELSWNSPHPPGNRAAEILYGYDAMQAFRAGKSVLLKPSDLA